MKNKSTKIEATDLTEEIITEEIVDTIQQENTIDISPETEVIEEIAEIIEEPIAEEVIEEPAMNIPELPTTEETIESGLLDNLTLASEESNDFDMFKANEEQIINEPEEVIIPVISTSKSRQNRRTGR